MLRKLTMTKTILLEIILIVHITTVLALSVGELWRVIHLL
jgi:hypothetical protein